MYVESDFERKSKRHEHDFQIQYLAVGILFAKAPVHTDVQIFLFFFFLNPVRWHIYKQKFKTNK